MAGISTVRSAAGTIGRHVNMARRLEIAGLLMGTGLSFDRITTRVGYVYAYIRNTLQVLLAMQLCVPRRLALLCTTYIVYSSTLQTTGVYMFFLAEFVEIKIFHISPCVLFVYGWCMYET